MNIYSGASGLGSALTNMTELARRKGTLEQSYPITIAGISFCDVEAAYQSMKTSDDTTNDSLMISIIAEKFLQHRDLFIAVQALGGYKFLQTCKHFTGAKTARFRSWEGAGLQSRFIRNLVAGYKMASEVIATEA